MSKISLWELGYDNHKLAAPISNMCWAINYGYVIKITEDKDMTQNLVESLLHNSKIIKTKDSEDYLAEMYFTLCMSIIINSYIDDNKIVGDKAAEYRLTIFYNTVTRICDFEKLK